MIVNGKEKKQERTAGSRQAEFLEKKMTVPEEKTETPEEKTETPEAGVSNKDKMKPKAQPKKHYIPKEKLSEYTGKKLWYDVRNLFGDDLIGLTQITVSSVDLEEDKIFYGGIEGFDLLSYYEKTFVMWEEKPTDEERQENWKKIV